MKKLITILFLFSIQNISYGKINFQNLKYSDNSDVSLEEINQGTKIVSFFFSSCAHTCLLINNKLKKINDKLPKDKNIQILSVTVDPVYDTPKRLKKYSSKWRQNNKTWKFISGPSEEIFRVIKEEFKLPGGGKAFVHSESVIILKNGEIKHSFSLFDKKEYKALEATLKI